MTSGAKKEYDIMIKKIPGPTKTKKLIEGFMISSRPEKVWNSMCIACWIMLRIIGTQETEVSLGFQNFSKNKEIIGAEKT